ncbi:ABC transporter permease [Eilatimonas milleporae]|uniref:Putative ABC transport system permease protein n=1 Tax=Eilatimonas milleporae TaxID=911205 RepID=A0A3M0C300_9PROT|nr:FtsX-like permease family protein [Eilatimonas milleporae]RMB02760.1 putative ABC transport system permease protein [Eilatimonas milleporae]
MITRHAGVPVAFRFALRELRGGLRGFRIFMACLILGVAAIAAVGSLTRAIQDGLNREGQNILGGDIEVSLFQQEAPASLVAFMKQKGDVSVSARLRTMARSQDTGQATLVELRAVDGRYPLYGDFLTLPQMDNPALFDKRVSAQGDETWGAAVDPLLADRLKVKVGDRLRVGAVTLDIRALIDKEPDKANLGFQLGPSLLVRGQALGESGLVTVGSLINHYYKIRLFAGNSVEGVREQMKERWPDGGWRVRDRSTSAPGLRRFIVQMETFLTLVGLAALVVGGVGVGNAVKGYMDRKTRTIATLKILGADGATIFATYFLQVLLIGLFSVAVGLGIGALLPGVLGRLLPDTIPVDIATGVYPVALMLAAAYGLLITIAFTAWPLGKARDLPAVRLFRALVAPETRRPRPLYMALIGGTVAMVALLAVGLANNHLLAGGFIAGAVGALALLRLTSWTIERGAARLPRARGALTRMAIANLHRPGAATGAVVISLGLGLTLFAALALIEGNLRTQLSEEVPSEAPAFFILDIQPDQLEDFTATADGVDGVRDVITVPSLRGRVIKLNGTPASEVAVDPDYRWILRGDRGLSYGMTPGEGSRVVEGDWWPDDYSGEPEISFGKAEAEGLGLDIGDTVTVTVLGREITARIRSLREINWGSFGFNFVILFDPHTLKAAPHTHMATLKADGPAEENAHRTLTQTFPNITAVRMKEVLSTVNGLLEQIGSAVRATAVVAILAGVLVLAGAIAAGFRQRVYESVILKVVGAVRGQVLAAYALEFLLIGLVTASIALGLGLLAGWIVVEQVMDMDFRILALPMLITVGASLGVTVLFGLASSFQALSIKPNVVLRSE